MTTHLNPLKEKIHDFVDGNLSDYEIDKLWAQLIGSPDDLDYLQTLTTLKKMETEGKFDHLYDSEPNVIPLSETKEPVKTPFYEQFKPFLVAASLLIIGFAILFNLLTNTQETQTRDAISMIEYEIERSVDNQTVLDNYLQRAVSLATNGSLNDAFSKLDEASALEQLTVEQSIDLEMVKGAIQYNAENYSEALQTFQNLKEYEEIDRLTREKGTWYLANTQLQLGMNKEAKKSMQEVIEFDGSFSRVAKQKLEHLNSN